jgi:hypothetical protein
MTGHDLAGSAAAAVARLVHEFGARAVPAGADPAQLLAPATALRVARQVELAARAEVGVHIRRAREAGLGWHEVGVLLGFGPLAADTGVPVADFAFDYCTGPPGRPVVRPAGVRLDLPGVRAAGPRSRPGPHARGRRGGPR